MKIIGSEWIGTGIIQNRTGEFGVGLFGNEISEIGPEFGNQEEIKDKERKGIER